MQLRNAAQFLVVFNLACSSEDPDGQSAPIGTGGAGSGGANQAGAAAVGGASAGEGGTAQGGGGTASGGSEGGTAGGAGTAAGGGTGTMGQFSIRFDYRFDTLGFFSDPARRAALEAAAAIWAAHLHDDFDPVPAGTSVRLFNPENREEYVWADLEEEIDDLLVFVGTSEAIAGLGRGGPSGTAETVDTTLAEALVARRDGADFEPWAGSISFKASSNFFFDATPETSDDIPPEAYDFISNAAHELGHVFGFSTSNAFTAFVDGTTFIGPEAVAAYGGPVPLDATADHIVNHTLSDGEETLMDSGQFNGVRIVPRTLDLAVFKDLGFEID